MIKVDLIPPVMGDDLAVVNAARVSFDKESELQARCVADCREHGHSPSPDCSMCETSLSEADRRLIHYLARGLDSKTHSSILSEIAGTTDEALIRECLKRLDVDKHWSPFSHTALKFRVKAPIFVARQLHKAHVGIVVAEGLNGWNEVSRRYVDDEPEMFQPEYWRAASDDKKQGSSKMRVFNVLVDGNFHTPEHLVEAHYRSSVKLYQDLLDNDICPELARIVLPQAMMTEWIWTGSLYAFARICRQRLSSTAQEEAGEVARQISEHASKAFPVSWSALLS